MRTIVFLSIITIALASQVPEPNCFDEPKRGMCLAYIPSWYYDARDQKCKEFIYGGCQGNGNRYPTEEACLEKCGGIVVLNATKKDICDLPPDEGHCNRRWRLYFYDKSDGKCHQFTYNGCGGNENKFNTLYECRFTCAKFPPDCNFDKKVGRCKERLSRYFFNTETEQCEEFVYSGCDGNNNNFHSQDDCEALCKSSKKQTCTEEPDAGKCGGYFPHFYYDPKSGTCKEFIFTGCGGNGNRYLTEDDCLEHCGVPINRTCREEPDTGKCSGYLIEYYYDNKSGTCKTFVYRGCGSNGNRYSTEEDCMENCGGPSSACRQEKEVGTCNGRFIRYYFNEDTGNCEEFVYGGCNGNNNNFLSQEDCEAVCKA